MADSRSMGLLKVSSVTHINPCPNELPLEPATLI
jgi:hypothetical protein